MDMDTGYMELIATQASFIGFHHTCKFNRRLLGQRLCSLPDLIRYIIFPHNALAQAAAVAKYNKYVCLAGSFVIHPSFQGSLPVAEPVQFSNACHVVLFSGNSSVSEKSSALKNWAAKCLISSADTVSMLSTSSSSVTNRL